MTTRTTEPGAWPQPPHEGTEDAISTTDPVERELDGAIATLWFHRPEKRNAIASETWGQSPRLLDKAAEAGARTLLLHGRDGHVCAGRPSAAWAEASSMRFTLRALGQSTPQQSRRSRMCPW